MMKRMLAMLLSVLMVLSLVGCGVDTSEETSKEAPIVIKVEELLARVTM